MKGREIILSPGKHGGFVAAHRVDGRLADLMIDPPDMDDSPRPEAIHLARAGRPMKGQGGTILDLGNGKTGFLRSPKPPPSGRVIIVQVNGWAEPHKAPPVTDRILLKGRTAILTPGKPGCNVARSIRDPDLRETLAGLAAGAILSEDVGVIVRSAAEEISDAVISEEIQSLVSEYETMISATSDSTPRCLIPAPDARTFALRDWWTADTTVRESVGALEKAGILEEIERIADPFVPLPGDASMWVEPTRALVAVDVNTGNDTSPAACLKANLTAIDELPRQLRLRGLGGQIVVDSAPVARKDRKRIETALGAALRRDGQDTAFVGWSALGNIELRRKRSRRPIQTLLSQVAP